MQAPTNFQLLLLWPPLRAAYLLVKQGAPMRSASLLSLRIGQLKLTICRGTFKFIHHLRVSDVFVVVSDKLGNLS